MSSFAKKLTIAAVACAAFSASAMADTQSTAPADYDAYTSWSNDLLSEVTFASGTGAVTALTGSVTIWDQGWGGEWEAGNQLYLSLDADGTQLWGDHFAGGTHGGAFVSFDIANDQAAFDSLNSALSGIDWGNTQTVSMQLRAAPIGWSGWELHARDAQFSVTTVAAVPEPGTYALMLGGLGAIVALSRRRKSAPAN